MDWTYLNDGKGDKPVPGEMIIICGIGKLSNNKQVRQGFLSTMDDTTFCDFMSDGPFGGKSSLQVYAWQPMPEPA